MEKFTLESNFLLNYRLNYYNRLISKENTPTPTDNRQEVSMVLIFLLRKSISKRIIIFFPQFKRTIFKRSIIYLLKKT